MLLMLNDHAIQLQRTSEVRDEYDIIIQSSPRAEGGIIHPQSAVTKPYDSDLEVQSGLFSALIYKSLFQ
jgi:hypothetical protein